MQASTADEQTKAGEARHPRVAKYLEPADVLVDQMRGRFSAWYRIRINLQHVPEKIRPRGRKTPSSARMPE